VVLLRGVAEPDLDGDGLSSAEELAGGASPFAADTDGDGLLDPLELLAGTDPALADTDGDGIPDPQEDSDEDGFLNVSDPDPGSGVIYRHADHLGGTVLVMRADAAVLERVVYKPYGEVVATAGGSTDAPPFGFTGQRYEASIGIYDYGARWYDPGLGRFLQPDSLVPEPANPQSLNRYAYALNNPTNLIDPTGQFQFSFDLGFFGFTFGTDRSIDGSFDFDLYPTLGVGFDFSFQVGESVGFGGAYEPGDIYGLGLNLGFRGGQLNDFSFGPTLQIGNPTWGERGFLGLNLRVRDPNLQLQRAITDVDRRVFSAGSVPLGRETIFSPADFSESFIASPYLDPAETLASTQFSETRVYSTALRSKGLLPTTVLHETGHLSGINTEAPAYALELEHARALETSAAGVERALRWYRTEFERSTRSDQSLYGLRPPEEYRGLLSR
jgi:RHS repeat-associated protein